MKHPAKERAWEKSFDNVHFKHIINLYEGYYKYIHPDYGEASNVAFEAGRDFFSQLKAFISSIEDTARIEGYSKGHNTGYLEGVQSLKVSGEEIRSQTRKECVDIAMKGFLHSQVPSDIKRDSKEWDAFYKGWTMAKKQVTDAIQTIQGEEE